ncbi:uncharacterized protein LOC133263563 isoform X1 [Pezoporus flaviventris]|uniref:uncharacterized protein LOC133263563 isoform X1 n=1 Tax=Pezoporus flaviventris TaxID=889875 RepID=UPI002AB242E0|nr:uncharacterized protein LOC133263563 isoform X1 [Pezoporus flaviventris]
MGAGGGGGVCVVSGSPLHPCGRRGLHRGGGGAMGRCQGRRAGGPAPPQRRPDAPARLHLAPARGAGGGGHTEDTPIPVVPPLSPPPAMGIQGMELCAVAVVILLFIAVLKQFGILEPISVEDGGDVEVELAAARHQPEELEELLARTKFSRRELRALYRGFKSECPSGLVDEETFTLIYSRFFPQGDASTYAHFLFDAFDADRNGALCFQVIHELFLRDHSSALAGAGARVDAGTAAPASPRGLKIAASENGNGINRDKTQFPPGRPPAPVQGCEMRVPSLGCHRDVPTQPQFLRQDFVLGLSVLLRGTVQQKLQWAFNLYDINKDGCITKEEMLEIMTSIYDMMGRCTQPTLRDCAPAEHVELFFQKMDRNGDGVVTFEEFLDTCLKDEDIMSSMRIFEDVL